MIYKSGLLFSSLSRMILPRKKQNTAVKYNKGASSWQISLRALNSPALKCFRNLIMTPPLCGVLIFLFFNCLKKKKRRPVTHRVENFFSNKSSI